MLAICAIFSSVMLISRQWAEDDRKAKRAARLEEAVKLGDTFDPFDQDEFYHPNEKDKND